MPKIISVVKLHSATWPAFLTKFTMVRLTHVITNRILVGGLTVELRLSRM